MTVRIQISPRIRRRGLAVLIASAIIAMAAFLLETTAPGTFAHARQQLGWRVIGAIVHHKYSDVRAIQTRELADWLADHQRMQPLLLDVREKAEYDMSHLPGAEHAGNQRPDLLLPDKSLPIVVYCSVGLRSAEAARRLNALGYSNVFNLEGSIFQWANEDRALEGGARVHPYNAQWGSLLRSDKRAASFEGQTRK